MQLQRCGQDGRGHQRGEAAHQRQIRGADHACVQMHGDLAAQRCALAAAAHPVAWTEPGRGGESRRVQSIIQRVLLPERQAELCRKRRLGAAVCRS